MAQETGDALWLARTALAERNFQIAVRQFELGLQSPQLLTAAELDGARVGLATAQFALGQLDAAEKTLEAIGAGSPTAVLPETLALGIELQLARKQIPSARVLMDRLPPEDSNPLLRRLRGRVLAAEGRWDEAIAHYEAWLEENPDLPGLHADYAWTLDKSGDTEAAKQAWQRAAAGPLADTDVQDALLRLVETDLNAGAVTNARERLSLLLGTNVLRDVLIERAYRLHARTLEAQANYPEAIRTFRALEDARQDPLEIALLRVQRAKLLIHAGDLSAAEGLMAAQIALLGDHPLAGDVQLFLANTLVGKGHAERAVQAFQTYLNVFTDPQGQTRATLGMAGALERLARWDEAGRMYDKARLSLPADDDTHALAGFKVAEMYFQGGNRSQAGDAYRDFIRDFPEHGLVPHALFQAALCHDMDTALESALDDLSHLRLRYPESPFAERALMERAGLLNRSLRLERALGAYDAYLERYPQGRFVVDAMMDKALTAYRMGYFELALSIFENVMTLFPAHPRTEQAFFMRGWALFLQEGRDQEALRVCRAFLEKHPNSQWAEDVRFWIAEYAFNHGHFAEAEKEFSALAEKAASPPAKAKSLYLAGRSALAAKRLQAAIDYFAQSVQADSQTSFMDETLFYRGDTLTEMNRFDEAILAFDELILRHPTSYLLYPAWGRKGDCQFTLGEVDPARFEEALVSYRVVDESATADPTLKLQAAYKIGRTLDRMGRSQEALANFLRVVFRFRDERARLGPDAELWFVRAATDAAQAYEKQANWRKAIEIYRHLVDAKVPQAREAEKRINGLRVEHLILF